MNDTRVVPTHAIPNDAMALLLEGPYGPSLWVEWLNSTEGVKQISPDPRSLRPGVKIAYYGQEGFDPRKASPLLVVTYYGDNIPDGVLSFETGDFRQLESTDLPGVVSPFLMALSMPTMLGRARDTGKLMEIGVYSRDQARKWGVTWRLSQWVVGYILAAFESSWSDLNGVGVFGDTSFVQFANEVTGVAYSTWHAWKRAASTYLLGVDDVPGLEKYTFADILQVPIDKAIRTLGAVHSGDMTPKKTELLMSPDISVPAMRAILSFTDEQLEEAEDRFVRGEPPPLPDGNRVETSRPRRVFDTTSNTFFLIQPGDDQDVWVPVMHVVGTQNGAQQWIAEIISATRVRVTSPPPQQSPHVVIEQPPRDIND